MRSLGSDNPPQPRPSHEKRRCRPTPANARHQHVVPNHNVWRASNTGRRSLPTPTCLHLIQNFLVQVTLGLDEMLHLLPQSLLIQDVHLPFGARGRRKSRKRRARRSTRHDVVRRLTVAFAKSGVQGPLHSWYQVNPVTSTPPLLLNHGLERTNHLTHHSLARTVKLGRVGD